MLRSWCVLLTVISLAAAGCGGPSGPKTVPVSGTVYLDDQPVVGVAVNFISAKHAGFGKTDSQGRYELVQGAVPGENKVTFSKMEGGKIALDPEAGVDEGQLEAMAAAEGGSGAGPNAPRQLIPPDYTDPAKTPVTFTVPEGGTTSADFRLTGKK
jgi:hypothetical protein